MIAIVLFLSLGVNTSPVHAYAYDSDFVSIIHYQNIGTSEATIEITIYDENGVVATHTPVSTLAPNAATALYAGTISGIPSGFKGSAVISSDQPLASTVAQAGSGQVLNQPLSNGFSSSETAPSVLIPTVLKNKFFFNSVFSVQNVDSEIADLRLIFKTTTGAETIYDVPDVKSQSSFFNFVFFQTANHMRQFM